MLQFLAVVGFMVVAIAIMAAALHFSQYKKRENAGCCGGGNCSTDGGSNDHSCYSSKADFVDNYKKVKPETIKTEKINLSH